LVAAVSAVQQWTTFSVPTPAQDAVAQILVHAREPYQGFNTYYDYLADSYKGKRTLLQEALETAGLQVVVPPGGFFIMADTSTWPDPPDNIRQLKTPSMPGSECHEIGPWPDGRPKRLVSRRFLPRLRLFILHRTYHWHVIICVSPSVNKMRPYEKQNGVLRPILADRLLEHQGNAI